MRGGNPNLGHRRDCCRQFAHAGSQGARCECRGACGTVCARNICWDCVQNPALRLPLCVEGRAYEGRKKERKNEEESTSERVTRSSRSEAAEWAVRCAAASLARSLFACLSRRRPCTWKGRGMGDKRKKRTEPRRFGERTKRPPPLDAAAAVYTVFHSAPHTQVRSRSHSCSRSCVDMRLPKTRRDNTFEDEWRKASLLLCLLPVLYDFSCDGLSRDLEKN